MGPGKGDNKELRQEDNWEGGCNQGPIYACVGKPRGALPCAHYNTIIRKEGKIPYASSQGGKMKVSRSLLSLNNSTTK